MPVSVPMSMPMPALRSVLMHYYIYIQGQKWPQSVCGCMNSQWKSILIVNDCYLVESKSDVVGAFDSLAFFDIHEDVSEFEWVLVLLESVRALNIEPENLLNLCATSSTLQVMTGTSSFTDFSFKHLKKLSSK